jgi:hypothetical protein
VVHDEVVTLEERFVYLRKTYGRSPIAVEKLQFMQIETERIENKIFVHLDFTPDQVIGLLTAGQ